MIQYVEVMSGVPRAAFRRMDHRAGSKVWDYLQGRLPNLFDGASPGQIQSLVNSLKFRQFVYEKLLNPDDQRTFWASEHGRALAEGGGVVAPKPPPDRRSDPRAVFGFVMDEPLVALAPCSPLDLDGNSPAQTCIHSGLLAVASGRFIEEISGRDRPAAGTQRIVIQLGKDRCSSWIDQCRAVATLAKGSLVAIDVATSGVGSQDTIEEKLSKRFGPARRQGTSSCALGSQTAPIRTWGSNGLTVTYWPHGPGNCLLGRVSVESETLKRKVKKAAADDPSI